MLERLLSYLGYYLKVRNLHRVHSPFVFNLYSEQIVSQREYYCFKPIEFRRTQLLIDKRSLPDSDPGAGSNKLARNLTVADVAQKSLVDAHYGQLLFRLVGHFKPNIILELGTSLGIAATYMSKAHKAEVHTIEGRSDIAEIAKETFKKLKSNNVHLHVGLFDEVLPELLSTLKQVDFVYLDGNHQYDATLRYVKMLLPYLHEESVLIVDDIRWSNGMIQAWTQLQQMDEFHVSLDLLRMGILMKRSHQKKEHFVLYTR
jgi:predicted O-methyltransferase YrrM